ncbi:c-type cytochrome biogenesis protein CcmI [Actibacterium sp. MT2.3-13A]|uniref:c-type cytochrome biogenesis protein CcmI n=1 Tax=Actibacterium sp. MT2.3-13A TaxID=2828332 RepID=UPI001BABB80E|nr:c-type cytochrome biogenesis protein CcmI [Actibacterium sp. MT2.3-13A]
MTFWLIAAALALLTVALLLLALMRGGRGQTPAAAYDLQVYRDQLREVEKDLARGVVTPEDAERVRVEVSRRILEADRALARGEGAGRAPRGATIAAGALAVAIVGGGTAALYQRVGAPGYPDLPLQARIKAADEARAARPGQAEAEAQMPALPQIGEPDPRHVELVEKLREVVKQRADDLQGYTLLARNEAMLGNFRAAYVAQSKVIELKQGEADATDFAAYADMMILAAGGYVSPQAEAALAQALNRDPANGTARYYAGLMYAQTGRPDLTFDYWRPLLENSQPEDPWVAPIRAQIEEIAMRAGADYRLPAPDGGPALRGPNAADMAAAAEMTAEERMEMIRGMVEGLSERLATEGGSPAEWARLVNALGMLGESERAAAIWAEAQQVFAGNAEALETVRASAERVGVAE